MTILNYKATNIPVLTHDAFVGFLEFNAFNPATAGSGTDTITAALNKRTLTAGGATVAALALAATTAELDVAGITTGAGVETTGAGVDAANATSSAVQVTSSQPAFPLLPGTDEILTFVPNAYFTGYSSTTAIVYITPGDGV